MHDSATKSSACWKVSVEASLQILSVSVRRKSCSSFCVGLPRETTIRRVKAASAASLASLIGVSERIASTTSAGTFDTAVAIMLCAAMQ